MDLSTMGRRKMSENLNKSWVLFHLKEAKSSLEDMISEIESDLEYEYGNYVVDMGHIYHHLNTAWNSRSATKEQIEPGTDEDFNKWNKFPTDLPMMELK